MEEDLAQASIFLAWLAMVLSPPLSLVSMPKRENMRRCRRASKGRQPPRNQTTHSGVAEWSLRSLSTCYLKLEMENVICTCIYNIFIYADGYDHLQNLLVILYRWMKSSALVHNVKLISVQMDTFICNYTCLVLIYMLMDVVICTS